MKFCPICHSEIQEGLATCPVCGFKFVGQTEKFEPMVLDNGSTQATPSSTGAVLRVIRGSQVGAVYELGQSSVTIGRNPACDIFLNDMTVSRMHARIEPAGGSYVISDIGSFNGVWVNNNSISHVTLKPGDLVQIGKFAFIFDEE